MKQKINSKPKVFVTTNRRILAMSASQNKEEVFKSINSNKVRIDRKEFRNLTPITLKKRKKEYKASNNKVLKLTPEVITKSPLANSRLLQNLKG